MKTDFRRRLQEGPIVCDGAMGTVLELYGHNSIPHEMVKKELEYVIKASFGFGDVNGCVLFKRWDGK